MGMLPNDVARCDTLIEREEMKLLTMKQVAEKLGYSYYHVAAVIQYAKGFPKPLRIHPKARPRWTEESLDNYANSTQDSLQT